MPLTPRQLRTLRARVGLTQAALASLIGVARVTYARWECGLHPIAESDARHVQMIVEKLLDKQGNT